MEALRLPLRNVNLALNSRRRAGFTLQSDVEFASKRINLKRSCSGGPTEVARRHSVDMFARGYFAHDTPEGRDPFERMREANVRFLTAGENLALAPTVQVAHRGLMNSPGHRANILHSQFGRVGIGIMDGGIRGLMITQDFRN